MIHAFQFQNRYIVLDVESGALHELTQPAYHVAKAIEAGLDPYTAGAAQEVAEILEEFSQLQEEGMFLSKPLTPPAPREQEQVIKAMCLHVAHDCNLRCRYCFASTGEFHGDRMLMSEAVGRAALNFLIARSGSRRNLEVDLFGGEPLLNFEVVKAIVAYGRMLERKHNKVIRFTMTTNCVGLDQSKIEYLNREMHNIVLSLDGRPEVHDAMRPAINGKGSYAISLKNAQAMVKARGEKEHYVRGTFTNRNLDFTEDVKSLRDAGFTQISMEPVVLAPDSPYAILEEHVGAVLDEYDRLTAFLQESIADGKWFNYFHFMVDFDNGPCLRKRITGCGAGTEYVAITPDGDIYPCHQFVGEEGFSMGNVLAGTFDTALQTAFAGCTVRTKVKCQSCWAKYFCSGGCAANAYKYNGDIMKPHEITCAFECKRTECAIGLKTEE